MNQKKARRIRRIMRLQQIEAMVQRKPLPPTRKERKAWAAEMIDRVLTK
jgi:hypothetical protein